MQNEYDEKEAIAFIIKALGEEEINRIGAGAIDKVLEYELDYLTKQGVISEEESISQYPVEIDIEDMAEFIAEKSGLNVDDILEILDAEEAYLESIGLIDDFGNEKWHN
jgi:hypothetical protein